jgi:hypothetical protein
MSLRCMDAWLSTFVVTDSVLLERGLPESDAFAGSGPSAATIAVEDAASKMPMCIPGTASYPVTGVARGKVTRLMPRELVFLREIRMRPILAVLAACLSIALGAVHPAAGQQQAEPRLAQLDRPSDLRALGPGIPGGFQGLLGGPQWVALQPPGAGFRVEMPGTATPSQQQVTVTATGEVVDQLEHSVVVSGVEYFIAHTLYRRMPSDLTPDQILVNGRNGRQGTLVSDRRLTVSGAAAREYVHDHDGAIFVTRAAYANNTLYQLIVVGPPGVENQPATRRFLDSFALVGR